LEKAYFHIIFSLNLNGIAKSLMFRRATLVVGFSSSSVMTIFSFNLTSASCSADFRFSDCFSSWFSCPGSR